MAIKYYFSMRAASPVVGETKTFTFDKTFTANGSVMGVYATGDSSEQTELDALVKNGRVKSISKENFEREIKKKRKHLPKHLQVAEASPVMGYQENPNPEAGQDAQPAELEVDDEPEIDEELPAAENEHSAEEAELTEQIDKPKRKSRKKKAKEEPAPAPAPEQPE